MPRLQPFAIKTDVASRAQLLLEQFAATGELPSAEAVEALERIARLAALAESHENHRLRSRWLAVLMVGTTLSILSALFFVRIPRTNIDLSVRVSDVEFVTTDTQVLTELTQLAVLGASRVGYLELPDASGKPLGLPAGGDASHAVRMQVRTVGERKGSITLASVPLPAGARVQLHHTAAGPHYGVQIDHPDLSLRVGLLGPLQVGLVGTQTQYVDHAIPRSMTLEPASDVIRLELQLDAPGALAPRLAVRELVLSRVDEFVDSSTTIVRRVPTILSGTLRFNSLNGLERSLSAGQALRFEGLRGELGATTLDNDGVSIRFGGDVTGIEAGPGTAGHDLMPTMLEWLQARHGLSLLWASTLYVLGLILGLLRWWGVRV